MTVYSLSNLGKLNFQLHLPTIEFVSLSAAASESQDVCSTVQKGLSGLSTMDSPPHRSSLQGRRITFTRHNYMSSSAHALRYYTVYCQNQIFLKEKNKTGGHVPRHGQLWFHLAWLLCQSAYLSSSRHKNTGSVCPERPQSQGHVGPRGSLCSQGDPCTVMFEFAGQHPTVQLVELHQLDQVSEPRFAIIQTVQNLAFIIYLQWRTHTSTQTKGITHKEKVTH